MEEINSSFPVRKAMRLRNFNYAASLCYFITITAYGRRCLFGHVENGEMKLNVVGEMISDIYKHLDSRFSKIHCMDFVVMPNHFHCIISLDNENQVSIPQVIGGFKSMTTVEYIRLQKKAGHKEVNTQVWQRSYWDDIIWNERQLNFIRNYISRNPLRWNNDGLNDKHSDNVDHISQSLKNLR